MLDSRDKGCCPCLQQPYVLVEQKPTDMSGSWPDLRAGNDLENASRTPHKLVGWVINLLLPSLLFLISLFCLFIWATVFLALLAILETCCSGSCLYKAPYHSTYFKVFNFPWSICNIIKKWEIKNAEDESLKEGKNELSNKSSVQFSSVAQSCPTLCDPMNCSMPGLPVHHQLPESTQTHVHWVGDAIQPSHPLSSPSPPALNLSQHQSLFQWVSSSSHQVAKVLEFQLQHQSFHWIFRNDFL